MNSYIVFNGSTYIGEFTDDLPNELPDDCYLLVNHKYWYHEKDHKTITVSRRDLPEEIRAWLLLMNL